MTQSSSQEWFMEVGGKKTGPFSTDQVLGLLADKEVPETQRITTAALKGKWITIRDLAKSQVAAEKVPPAPKPFTPPPRPSEIAASEGSKISIMAPPKEDLAESMQSNDPALSLFDALQAARERKAITSRPLPPEDNPNPFAFENIPQKAWMIAGLVVVLTSSVWGMVHFIKQKAAYTITPIEAAAPSHVTTPAEAAAARARMSTAPASVPVSQPAPPPPTVAAAVQPPPLPPPQTRFNPAMSAGNRVMPMRVNPPVFNAPPPPPQMNMNRDAERDAPPPSVNQPDWRVNEPPGGAPVDQTGPLSPEGMVDPGAGQPFDGNPPPIPPPPPPIPPGPTE